MGVVGAEAGTAGGDAAWDGMHEPPQGASLTLTFKALSSRPPREDPALLGNEAE